MELEGIEPSFPGLENRVYAKSVPMDRTGFEPAVRSCTSALRARRRLWRPNTQKAYHRFLRMSSKFRSAATNPLRSIPMRYQALAIALGSVPLLPLSSFASTPPLPSRSRVCNPCGGSLRVALPPQRVVLPPIFDLRPRHGKITSCPTEPLPPCERLPSPYDGPSCRLLLAWGFFVT